MEPGAIIEYLDVVEDRRAGFGSGAEAALVDELVLETAPERLDIGVVVAVALAAPVCVVSALSNQSLGFVEFFDAPGSRQGFALAHLIHYRLALREAADLVGDGREAAPQVLTLGFSTADVVVTGWRLERAAEFLQAGTLAAVKTIPARHVAMTGNRPAVVAIEIHPVSPGKGGL